VVAGTIPIKTPDGQDELGTRQRRVSQRHRTVLFLVDGKRSATEVRSMALKAGVPESCFDELLELGLIEVPEPTVAELLGSPDVLHVELPLAGPDSANAPLDSLLPPSRTLYRNRSRPTRRWGGPSPRLTRGCRPAPVNWPRTTPRSSRPAQSCCVRCAPRHPSRVH
jgi:hypothetical protein